MAVESPKKERGGLGALGSAALAVVALIVVLVMAGRRGGPDRRPGVAVPSTATRFGDLGTLRLPGGGGEVWLATSEEDRGPMLAALDAAARGGPRSGAALARLAAAGRVCAYASGTRVRVTKTSSSSRYVEVVDGEVKGRSGWVPREFVLGAK